MRKLFVMLGLGFAAKKLFDARNRPTTSVNEMDRDMDRHGFPGGVRP